MGVNTRDEGFRPVVLLILDGWGVTQKKIGNAIASARAENFRSLCESKYPSTVLGAAGQDVGLPNGFIGNSEVGHLHIGAGRIIKQPLSLISEAVRDGSFFENGKLLDAVARVKARRSKVHLMGLLSDGGVHSHINHLFALLEVLKGQAVGEVVVHAILDGRDTPPKSAKRYISQLERKMRSTGCGRIGTVMGRYYAMDRDKRWERVEKAYRAMTGAPTVRASSAVEAVSTAYDAGVTDEFVVPTAIGDGGSDPMTDGDLLIFFNFRPDRAREIMHAFTCRDFAAFPRAADLNVRFLGMMRYNDEMPSGDHIYQPVKVGATLGEIISKKGYRQLRIAETEKYAHVTLFFNGEIEKPFRNEDRCIIPSPRDVPTYDLKPEMSAYQVADETVRRIESEKYDFIVCNLANGDMVGHSGNFSATVAAVEVVDACVGRILKATERCGGLSIITSDHGNAEQMIDYKTGEPHTAHTMNPVRFIIGKRMDIELTKGGLSNIAPTILDLMGMPRPREMREPLIKPV